MALAAALADAYADGVLALLKGRVLARTEPSVSQRSLEQAVATDKILETFLGVRPALLRYLTLRGASPDEAEGNASILSTRGQSTLPSCHLLPASRKIRVK